MKEVKKANGNGNNKILNNVSMQRRILQRYESRTYLKFHRRSNYFRLFDKLLILHLSLSINQDCYLFFVNVTKRN